jgi:hypothetical protein
MGQKRKGRQSGAFLEGKHWRGVCEALASILLVIDDYLEVATYYTQTPSP